MRGIAALWIGAALLLGCAQKQAFWTRVNMDPGEFERTSGSCTARANLDADGQAAASVGFDRTRQQYRKDDPATQPNTENERRRRETRVRALYGQCMEVRGWKKNTRGEGFKGM